jgi:hypothetical protein
MSTPKAPTADWTALSSPLPRYQCGTDPKEE